MSLFQSNLRKQIRNLPKILNFVKKIHYYCELFTSLLNFGATRRCPRWRDGRPHSRCRCRRPRPRAASAPAVPEVLWLRGKEANEIMNWILSNLLGPGFGKNFAFERVKNVDEVCFCLRLNGAKVCESCRSRQELSNEYLVFTIYLQKTASIQPRTGLSEFAKN